MSNGTANEFLLCKISQLIRQKLVLIVPTAFIFGTFTCSIIALGQHSNLICKLKVVYQFWYQQFHNLIVINFDRAKRGRDTVEAHNRLSEWSSSTVQTDEVSLLDTIYFIQDLISTPYIPSRKRNLCSHISRNLITSNLRP